MGAPADDYCELASSGDRRLRRLNQLRVIILTSTFRRHNYVVNYVADRLEVAGVLQEEKSFKPFRAATSDDDMAVITKHFLERDNSEVDYFEDHRTVKLPLGIIARTGPSGIINEQAEIDPMSALCPDVVLVFGTGLLGANIIERFSGRIINLHLGLSPYYRGAGTNFWPLVNREPEFVGATIHYLDSCIDTGPLIAHARPTFDAQDGPHDLGNRAIIAGAETLVQAARAHAEGRLKPVPQTNKGRLYQRKQFSADAIRQLWRNFSNGMIAEYLEDQTVRDTKVDLLSVPNVS